MSGGQQLDNFRCRRFAGLPAGEFIPRQLLPHKPVKGCVPIHRTDHIVAIAISQRAIRIGAEIYVMRNTQKAILLGKGGAAIKQLGIKSRAAIEEFLGQHIFLELHVKIRDKWRDDERSLKGFGYSV